jgi:predicted N-acetyltransferase YhbS
MVEISLQTAADEAAIEMLMDGAFGAARHSRSVWMLRVLPPIAELSLVLRDGGAIMASLRFWEVQLGSQIVLLLGPLAVQPELRGKGYGRKIVADGLARARAINEWPLVLVSGEPEYYPKFGFESALPYQLDWPGFIEPGRLQILELQAGTLVSLVPPLRVRAKVE